MQKILLALGHRRFEELVIKHLGDKYTFTEAVTYQEALLGKIETLRPDIVVMKEGLPGNGDWASMLFEIRQSYPEMRIVFITKDREIGDEFLAVLVSYGIYDLIVGESIKVQTVVDLVLNPNDFNAVSKYMPKAKIDPRTGKKMFETKVIKETVIVEQPVQQPEASKQAMFAQPKESFPKRAEVTETIDDSFSFEPEPIQDPSEIGYLKTKSSGNTKTVRGGRIDFNLNLVNPTPITSGFKPKAKQTQIYHEIDDDIEISIDKSKDDNLGLNLEKTTAIEDFDIDLSLADEPQQEKLEEIKLTETLKKETPIKLEQTKRPEDEDVFEEDVLDEEVKPTISRKSSAADLKSAILNGFEMPVYKEKQPLKQPKQQKVEKKADFKPEEKIEKKTEKKITEQQSKKNRQVQNASPIKETKKPATKTEAKAAQVVNTVRYDNMSMIIDVYARYQNSPTHTALNAALAIAARGEKVVFINTLGIGAIYDYIYNTGNVPYFSNETIAKHGVYEKVEQVICENLKIINTLDFEKIKKTIKSSENGTRFIVDTYADSQIMTEASRVADHLFILIPNAEFYVDCFLEKNWLYCKAATCVLEAQGHLPEGDTVKFAEDKLMFKNVIQLKDRHNGYEEKIPTFFTKELNEMIEMYAPLIGD